MDLERQVRRRRRGRRIVARSGQAARPEPRVERRASGMHDRRRPWEASAGQPTWRRWRDRAPMAPPARWADRGCALPVHGVHRRTRRRAGSTSTVELRRHRFDSRGERLICVRLSGLVAVPRSSWLIVSVSGPRPLRGPFSAFTSAISAMSWRSGPCCCPRTRSRTLAVRGAADGEVERGSPSRGATSWRSRCRPLLGLHEWCARRFIAQHCSVFSCRCGRSLPTRSP